MSPRFVFALAATLACAPVFALAQDVAARPDQPALPPPGLNDPGVDPAAAPPSAQTTPAPGATPAELEPTRLPGKPIPLPRQPGDTGPTEAIPDVRVHEDGDRTIQEYRQSGRLYMVVVTPKNGVPQTYMVDAQGKLRNEAGQPPVRPVMYKIMEWGKSAPASQRETPPPATQDAGQRGD